MGEFNSDNHYIYYCGQESLRRNGVAIIVKKKSPKCSTLMQYQKRQNDLCFQKEAFFREYLPALSMDPDMFRFFLVPQTERFSDEFIHLSFDKKSPVRSLLEMMVIEYADKKEDSQLILKPMVLALFMHIARSYRQKKQRNMPETLSGRILQYINSHPESATLKDIADRFSYHPNYISSLLHKEIGKTFSEIVLERRMERAAILLKGTTLSIEEISAMLGYTNTSNFYKAFREYYGKTPRRLEN